MRERVTAARRGLDDGARADADAALVRHAVAWALAQVGHLPREERVIAAHAPRGLEPGASAELVTALDTAGLRVLLPVCPPGPAAPLRWGFYDGELVVARFRLLEPTRASGPETLCDARAILLPAVAADARGMRLGWGTGYYDRSLPFSREDVPTAVLLHESDIVDEVPSGEHDQPVGAIITAAGVRPVA